MLLEFDADQRLWRETVRDAVGKQCPPALVRGVAEDGVDPTPVWKAYVEHGWTEMSDPRPPSSWPSCWKSWAAPPIRLRFWRR